MTRHKGRLFLSVCCVSATWLLGATAPAQMGNQIPSLQSPLHHSPNEDEAGRRELMEKMEKRRNDLRQEQLVKDTNKLLALATELKSQVDKTNKDVLSVDVVKKAEEIEKLAKNVKDRMRD